MSCGVCGCRKDESSAAKERARIRFLVGPALRELRTQWSATCCTCRLESVVGRKPPCATCRTDQALHSIDAATRPESKRKAKPSVYLWCSCGKCAPCPDRGSPDCSHDDEHPYRFNLKRCRDAYEAATSKRKAKVTK